MKNFYVVYIIFYFSALYLLAKVYDNIKHMKAVILCAGRGSRLAPLTDTIPKPLIPLKKEKVILDFILDSLPDTISEVFLVTGHLAFRIEEYVRNYSGRHKITCIPQNPAEKGTYAAVSTIKPYLSENELFYIQNGDDLFEKQELSELVRNITPMFCVGTQILPKNYWSIHSISGIFAGFKEQTEQELINGANAGTGAYLLNTHFFKLLISQTANSETSIPHTLRDNLKIYPVKIFYKKYWITVNDFTELENAKKYLARKIHAK